MVPFIFSSLAIRAVELKQLYQWWKGFAPVPYYTWYHGRKAAKPEYDKCVAISTEASIRKMMLPGAIAIISPLIMSFAQDYHIQFTELPSAVLFC